MGPGRRHEDRCPAVPLFLSNGTISAGSTFARFSRPLPESTSARPDGDLCGDNGDRKDVLLPEGDLTAPKRTPLPVLG